jgi:sulfate transport system ATP-binding protein
MALARALAVEPKVLLLDEPFGALDARVRKELRDWLRRLHDEVHVTTVFVTHDQEEALEVSDQIVVINEGRIEQVGTPDELYDEPANDFVMSFLGPVTTLGERLVRPHDIEVFVAAVPDSLTGEVVRLQRIGFEVRAEVRAAGSDSWVQLTRGQAEALELGVGSRVWLRAAPHATTLPLRQSARADLGEDGLRGAGVAQPGGA